MWSVQKYKGAKTPSMYILDWHKAWQSESAYVKYTNNERIATEQIEKKQFEEKPVTDNGIINGFDNGVRTAAEIADSCNARNPIKWPNIKIGKSRKTA